MHPRSGYGMENKPYGQTPDCELWSFMNNQNQPSLLVSLGNPKRVGSIQFTPCMSVN